MLEKAFYEQDNLWRAERWLEGPQLERLLTCVNALPANMESLLDVGAGNGAFLSLVEQRIGHGLKAAGVERSQAALKMAVCRSPLFQASAEALPYPNRAFDLVSALELIEHLPWGVYENTLAELGRVACRYVMINVPYRERRLHVPCPFCKCQFNPFFHMRSFSDDGLKQLLPGFGLVTLIPIESRDNLLRALTLPFRRRVFGGFPPTAMCPQCGYHQFTPAYAAGKATASGLARMVRAIAARLPQVRRTTEVVALYLRQD